MNYRHLILALLSGLLIAAPVLMFQPRVHAATLTEEEEADCGQEGGCALVTRAKLEALLEHAFKAGVEKGRLSCRNAL